MSFAFPTPRCGSGRRRRKVPQPRSARRASEPAEGRPPSPGRWINLAPPEAAAAAVKAEVAREEAEALEVVGADGAAEADREPRRRSTSLCRARRSPRR